MRQGIHEEALSNSTRAADHVIWYEPANVGWDMSHLTSDQSEIVSDMSSLLDTIMKAVNDRKGPMHLLIMSNGSFSGLHRSLVDALSA